jgi:hypothetical protein
MVFRKTSQRSAANAFTYSPSENPERITNANSENSRTAQDPIIVSGGRLADVSKVNGREAVNSN